MVAAVVVVAPQRQGLVAQAAAVQVVSAA